MDQQEQFRWRSRVLWIVGILAALVVVAILFVGTCRHGCKWTGFANRTLWDWLRLLGAVAVPVLIAYFGQRISSLQYLGQREAEEERAQDEALQAYLDQMSQLLTDQRLRAKTHWLDEARVTARARSLAALWRLDGERKKSVLQFLYEAQLINRREHGSLVGLSGADLTSTDLRYITLRNAALNGAHLENADLREAKLNGVNLGGAYLSGADLSGADLRDASLVNADLRKAKLNSVDLRGAYLSGANLSNAKLRNANLTNAHLQRKDEEELNGANLSGADLTKANLSGADLSGANLTDAYELFTEGSKREDTRRVTNEQLEAQQTKTLEGATMPNGQNYEDWLKSKGRESDG